MQIFAADIPQGSYVHTYCIHKSMRFNNKAVVCQSTLHRPPGNGNLLFHSFLIHHAVGSKSPIDSFLRITPGKKNIDSRKESSVEKSKKPALASTGGKKRNVIEVGSEFSGKWVSRC